MLALSATFALAHAIETLVGFGSAVVVLALLSGARMPLEQLVAVLALLGLAQATWNLSRERKKVRWDVVLRETLPLALLGLLAGRWLCGRLPADALKTALGAFITASASLELAALAWRRAGVSDLGRARVPLRQLALAVAGGVFHGMFAAGGPLLVHGISRRARDKSEFRGSLAALWLVLDASLAAAALSSGRIGAPPSSTLKLAALLLPALAVGILVGETLHSQIPERPFRALAYALLALSGGRFLL